MSHPFGGHPTFGKYLAWARDEHGFHAQTGIAADKNGRSHSVTKVFKQGGQSVVVTDVSQNEHLVPTMVSHLDRRLGIVSPWFSTDAPDLDG